jgi:putative DNA primase/helicase
MDTKQLTPKFDDSTFEPETLICHINDLISTGEPIPHDRVLKELTETIELLDFKALAFPEITALRNQQSELSARLTNIDGSPNIDPGLENEREQFKAISKTIEKVKTKDKHLLILCIENLRALAIDNKWGLCKNNDFIYLYNGAFWKNIENEEFQKFLGEAAEKMGVAMFEARFYQFRERLLKQFLSTEYLSTPIPPSDAVFVNLQNGTFEITANKPVLRAFNRLDFITYQLPFECNPGAAAPLFKAYLDKVLPDIERQNIIQEYLGYIFIQPSTLKLEKTLLLYGSGANGKSVFFEIVNALLGSDNVSSYSLQSLTNENGYFRAKLANKLVNYASEINGNLETSIFKQLVSGEPVEARLPYGQPFVLTKYAKLIFNCNELPKDVEHTNAYFRRLIIVPFDVTIPEAEQDKQLSQKIIKSELAGVFNWALEGLNRLLKKKSFTDCKATQIAREQYEKQSDSVRLFIDESSYEKCSNDYTLIKYLYNEYRTFCFEDGFKPVNKTNFIKRLNSFDVIIEKKNVGNVAFMAKRNEPF